jgi:autotransporter-associated beta strand protein
MTFGATSGSTHNWFLNSSGGSAFTLAPQVSVSIAPASGIAVNQNTATLLLPFVSSNGLAKTGAGTLVLAGTNTIIGPLNLNGGELNFLSLSNLPVISDGSAISSINFSNGALQWASGNTLDISSLGIPISFAGTAGFDTGPNNITFSSGFGDAGAGGLKKLGAGTLTLNGAVYYTGTTTVSNGVLALGSSGSIPSSTNITVSSGATLNVSAWSGGLTLNWGETLAGAGTVLGNISDNSSVTIAPGVSGAGTLTVNGNLTLNGGGILTYDLANVTPAGGGVNDLTAVTGTLTIAGSTTLNVNLLNGSTASSGTYTLFTYGTFAGSAANITVPSGYSITNNTTAKTIGLIVNHTPANLVWQGDGSANVWDTDATQNWLQAGISQYFFTGDAVTFNDAGSAVPSLYISGDVSPASVTVNASQSYDFIGGAIATGQLTKNGNGTLILENNNTYNGSTLISGGTLQVGGPIMGGATGRLGSGPVTNNGALVFDLASNSTVATNIYGTGSITNIGSSGTVTLSGNVTGNTITMAGFGTLVLSGSNSYTGPTIISSGSVQANNSFALGTTASNTVVSSGAQLYVNANVNMTNSLSLIGTGPVGDGALRKGGNGTTTYGGVITLAGDTLFAVDGGSTLNLTNAAGITGCVGAASTNLTLGGAGAGVLTGPLKLGSGSLTKIGAGAWTLAPTNTYTGTTFLNAGTLNVSAPTALGPVSIFTPAYVTFAGGTLQVTTNVTFADGLGGFTVTTTANFDVPVGLTLNISNVISGAGSITKHDSGTLVLAGPNSFSGTLFVDGGHTAGDDGTTLVANPNAIASVLSPIAIRNNNGGSSTLGLVGTNGNITLTQDITLRGRSPAVPAILNVAGTNTLAGNLTCGDGGGQYLIESDSGLLTLGSAGTSLTYTTLDPQTLTFQGNGSFSVAGVIADSSGPAAISIKKNGNGSLALNAVNTYTGTTTVNAGTLSGTGTIAGPVIVGAGGTFAPGAPLGTLTINNTLSLAGNALVTVNKTSGTSGQVAGLASVTYGGTLTVTNVSGTLAAGDNFQIFPATTFTGNFSSISPAPSGGLGWSFNRTNGVLSVVSVMATNPTNILAKVNGNKLELTWPVDHTGWILQAQTNALNLGLSSNWFDVPGSTSVNSVTNPINPANGSVFYRLVKP